MKILKSFRYRISLFLFVILIFFVSSTLASVTLVNNSIRTAYLSGDKIQGSVIIRANTESALGKITSNFGTTNFTFNDWLKSQSSVIEGVDYTCSTYNCESEFTSGNISSSIFVPQIGTNSGTGGFLIHGANIHVKGVSFVATGNSGPSCNSPFILSVLNQPNDKITTWNHNGLSCGVKYRGCYNNSLGTEADIIPLKKYCEKINLPASPGFIIGGKIRNSTAGNATLTMELYESSGVLRGTCKLPMHTQNIQELSCIVNSSASINQDYFVCISASQNVGYKIGWETAGPTCGTAEGFSTLASDFDLYAEALQFAPNPSINLNSTSFFQQTGQYLEDTLDSYLTLHYNRDCQTKSCFIPFTFYGSSNYISIVNPVINYESSGVPLSSTTFYSAKTEEPFITTNYNITLPLDIFAFSILPNSIEKYFKLYLNNNLIVQKNISIGSTFALDVYPRTVAFGALTTFTAVTAGVNLTNTTWIFGDGSSSESVNGRVNQHRYISKNSTYFDITLTAFAKDGRTTQQIFRINIGSPRNITNQTLKEYRSRLNNITQSISSFPNWITSRVKTKINIDDLNAHLAALENQFHDASLDEQYQSILIELLNMQVPIEVTLKTENTAIPLSAGIDSIDINYLAQIENSEISNKPQVKNQAVGFMNEYFNPLLTNQFVEVHSELNTETIETIFSIVTSPIQPVSETVYLIFGQDVESAGLFKEQYTPRKISGGNVNYVLLDGTKSQQFDFIIDGRIEGQTLGAYIAPRLSVLEISDIGGTCTVNSICEKGETAQTCPEDCSKKPVIISVVLLSLLFIVAVIIYIIIQQWYKKNYQHHLFPNENDLYNIITFIYSSRKNNLTDKIIRETLRKKTWTSEQINFAFKKLQGERLNFLEIPVFTGQEHQNTLKQIATREGGMVDARFIKRPSF